MDSPIEPKEFYRSTSADPERVNTVPFFSSFPMWFVGFATLIYATGFLAVTTFHDSYKLRGLDAGFFKIKYAHVGFMFIFLPLILGVSTYGLLHYAHRKKELEAAGKAIEPFKGPPHPLVIGIMFIVGITFYLYVLFGPPGTFREVHWDLAVMIGVAIAGRLIAELLVNNNLSVGLMPVRIGTLLFLLFLSFRITWPFKDQLIAMFWPSGLWYFSLSIFMGWLIWILVGRQEFTAKNRDAIVWGLTGLTVLALVYYLTILSFGLGVYHYIPAGKGGGDFSDATLISLVLMDEAASKLPKWISANNPNNELLLEVIESSEHSIYVANPWTQILDLDRASSGPIIWRDGRKHRPQVLEIPRDHIIMIQYRNVTYRSWLDIHTK